MRRLLALAVLAVVAACTSAGDGATATARAPAADAGEAVAGVPPASAPATTVTTVGPGPTTTTAPPPATTAPAGVDACPTPGPRRAPDPARPTYDVDLAVALEGATTARVTGTSTIAFTPDLPVDSLVLRLWAEAPRPAGAGTRIDVGVVTEVVGERREPRATSRPDPTTLVVELGRWLPAGETVRIEVPVELVVRGPVNDRISAQAGSLRLGSGLPLLAWEPGRGWSREPATALFAEAVSSPTADWTLDVAVPEGLGAIASGVEVAPGRWRAEAVRDVSVAVGRWTTLEATAMAPDPVRVTVSVHDGVDDPGAYLATVVASLERFASWYGPYPWPAYHLSITPDLSGGIEFPMHVLQGPGTQGRTTPHEVAHMWFYGLVGNDQGRDPWLDEGLATWAEGRFLGTLPAMRGRDVPAAGRGRAAEPLTYWAAHPRAYYRSVYVQTAAALSRIGGGSDEATDLVDCALALYVADRAHAVAVPDDVRRALGATFGATDWRTPLGEAGLG